MKFIVHKGKRYRVDGPVGWFTSGVKVAYRGKDRWGLETGPFWRKLPKDSKTAAEVRKLAGYEK